MTNNEVKHMSFFRRCSVLKWEEVNAVHGILELRKADEGSRHRRLHNQSKSPPRTIGPSVSPSLHRTITITGDSTLPSTTVTQDTTRASLKTDMFRDNYPPSQQACGTAPWLPPNSPSSDAFPYWASQSEQVPDLPQSSSDTNRAGVVSDHTSWLPSELVPPGSFDDDLSVISEHHLEGATPIPGDGELYAQKIFCDAIFSMNGAHASAAAHASDASAGDISAHLNIVSPVARSNLASFHNHEPRQLQIDMAMEVGDATALLDSDKDASWMENYRALQEFKAEHGHTNVPQEYFKNPSLGNWVKYNRQKMRDGTEDLEKMALLHAIGLKCYIGKGNAAKVNGAHYSARQVKAWEEQFMNLCKYKEENGDCNVPSNETGKWKSLGEWVKRQRKVYRQFHSSGGVEGNRSLVERFHRLEKIGFKFHIGSGKWRDNL